MLPAKTDYFLTITIYNNFEQQFLQHRFELEDL